MCSILLVRCRWPRRGVTGYCHVVFVHFLSKKLGKLNSLIQVAHLWALEVILFGHFLDLPKFRQLNLSFMWALLVSQFDPPTRGFLAWWGHIPSVRREEVLDHDGVTILRPSYGAESKDNLKCWIGCLGGWSISPWLWGCNLLRGWWAGT